MNSGQGFDEKADVVKRLKAQLRRREEENVGLAKKLDSLEEERDAYRAENRNLKETLNRAKDIRPQARPNFDNVRQMARAALLEVVKAPGGFLVKMGNCIGKKFKRLRDIWLILTREDWNLHDGFLPNVTEPAPARARAPARAPARARAPLTLTRKEVAEIEALRAQWRLFPSQRPMLEKEMARLGALEVTQSQGARWKKSDFYYASLLMLEEAIDRLVGIEGSPSQIVLLSISRRVLNRLELMTDEQVDIWLKRNDFSEE